MEPLCAIVDPAHVRAHVVHEIVLLLARAEPQAARVEGGGKRRARRDTCSPNIETIRKPLEQQQ